MAKSLQPFSELTHKGNKKSFKKGKSFTRKI